MMPKTDDHVIHFQCPKCGHELAQSIGLLKAERLLICSGCDVSINFDTARLVAATEALQDALPGPNEITIKFFR
jgi:transcription elongation factor Elf1